MKLKIPRIFRKYILVKVAKIVESNMNIHDRTILFFSLVENDIYIFEHVFLHLHWKNIHMCKMSCEYGTHSSSLVYGFTPPKQEAQSVILPKWKSCGAQQKALFFHSCGPLIHDPNNSWSYLHCSKRLKRSIFMFWFDLCYEKFVEVSKRWI